MGRSKSIPKKSVSSPAMVASPSETASTAKRPIPVELLYTPEKLALRAASREDTVPHSLVEMLEERGRYEEELLDEIKVAFDEGDSPIVMTLVGLLLYEGPGIAQGNDCLGNTN
jgi:hypothetical protein